MDRKTRQILEKAIFDLKIRLGQHDDAISALESLISKKKSLIERAREFIFTLWTTKQKP